MRFSIVRTFTRFIMDTKTKNKDIEINTHNQYNSPGLNKNDLKVDPIDQLKNVGFTFIQVRL